MSLATFAFAFECDRRWDEMTATESDDVRFCSKCQESVVYCDTIGQAREHAGAGRCVAVDHRVTRHPGDLGGDTSTAWTFPITYPRIGLPEPEPEDPHRTRREREAEARRRRDREPDE